MDDTTSPDALVTGSQWIAALLTGSIGVSACVLGVAALGYLMLSGRTPVRRGGAAIIGCFIILSASAIGFALPSRSPEAVASQVAANVPPPPNIGQPAYDPYAFASLQR